jgi:hypothetical protein
MEYGRNLKPKYGQSWGLILLHFFMPVARLVRSPIPLLFSYFLHLPLSNIILLAIGNADIGSKGPVLYLGHPQSCTIDCHVLFRFETRKGHDIFFWLWCYIGQGYCQWTTPTSGKHVKFLSQIGHRCVVPICPVGNKGLFSVDIS